MVEKKTSQGTAVTTTVKTAVKKTTTKAKVAKKTIFVEAENAGFRAGDVYQALYAAGASKSVEELEKLTGKTEVEVLLGIGWLLKEGKVKGDGGKVVLA